MGGEDWKGRRGWWQTWIPDQARNDRVFGLLVARVGGGDWKGDGDVEHGFRIKSGMTNAKAGMTNAKPGMTSGWVGRASVCGEGGGALGAWRMDSRFRGNDRVGRMGGEDCRGRQAWKGQTWIPDRVRNDNGGAGMTRFGR